MVERDEKGRFKKGNKGIWLGKKRSIETIESIRKSKIGVKKKTPYKEYFCLDCGNKISNIYAKRCRRCNSEYFRGENNPFFGKKHNKESLKKISNSTKNRIISEKTRERMKESSNKNPYWLVKSGCLSPNWKGGISKIDRLIRQIEEYKIWRTKVFERDKWTCKTCNNNNCYVTAHHIKSFSLIIKENNIYTIEEARKVFELWDINNGVTLCEKCHSLTDNYMGRAKKKNV